MDDDFDIIDDLIWIKHISQYLQNCHECHCVKLSQLHYQRVLKPLSVSEHCWVDIFMNFVKDLSSSLNKNRTLCITMIVIVNHLSKQAHVIPWSEMTAKDTAIIFYYWVFSQHSLSNTIVSDWETQFVSYFWLALCNILDIKAQLFTVRIWSHRRT